MHKQTTSSAAAQAAEKERMAGEILDKLPSGAKARVDLE
jgi:hypothetical protein